MTTSIRLDDVRGGWAIVTGASSGIGRAYALALARRGLNLLLVARRTSELQALAAEIEAASGMRALALPLDLASPGAVDQVLRALGDRPLRLLVSNAGSGLWGAHDTAHHERYAEVIALNVSALVALTTALLPALRTSSPSAIVHVSSQAAYQPVPYMAVYAASKAFVHSFSLALHEELREQGVLVQTLVPAPTETEFDAKAGAYSSAVVARGTTAAVVQASLAGLDRGDALATNATGLWKQRLFAGLAPPAMVVREVGKMFRPPPT
ncbi:MAG: SDR family NAD(P)-dependent oxidoreductase [Burkholderiales bacterium]|nr:SDR family NAD(P)-dependent oxidoreductase [Burkholderiales bacterium]